MKITHKIPGLNVSKDGCDTSSFVLSNGIGSFLFLSSPAVSKFNGFLVNKDMDIFKTVENIFIEDSEPVEIENDLTFIRRKHKDNVEKIACIEGANAFSYTLTKKAPIIMDVDCRRINDMRTFGRIYRVDVEKSRILIEFTKRTDWRDDPTEDKEEFKLFVAIRPKGFVPEKDYSIMDQWPKVFYSYDSERHDSPANRFVYRPFRIKAKEIIISAGTTKAEALAELDKAERLHNVPPALRKLDRKKGLDIAAAFACAQDSLDKLTMVYQGTTRIYAGYPWFFQLWSRDENVCLGAMIRLGQFEQVREILLKYLDHIDKVGRLPNHIPSPHLGSADGVGWFWKRVGDYLEAVEGDDEFQLSAKELDMLKKGLETSITRIEKRFKKGGLITNLPKETWMDTDEGRDLRDGARIEVQGLHLNMLRLMHKLNGENKYRLRENKMKKTVIEKFWNGKVLADGADDYTVRPNIFITYYAYPELLSRRDWQTAFESCLEKCWLDWGGLSSIDKEHGLFQPDYTGMTNESYHRGDSWYWINHLAALCMFRNNPIEFEDKIRQIINASSEETLWHGTIGHNAEVSSASHLSSYGCFAQAWSVAMFIELILEVYGNGK